MRYGYSDELAPPGLMVPSTVFGLGSEIGLASTAKVDTGADLSIMPESLRRSLGLKPAGIVQVKGAFDRASRSEPT
jgi:hypothetical protein